MAPALEGSFQNIVSHKPYRGIDAFALGMFTPERILFFPRIFLSLSKLKLYLAIVIQVGRIVLAMCLSLPFVLEASAATAVYPRIVRPNSNGYYEITLPNANIAPTGLKIAIKDGALRDVFFLTGDSDEERKTTFEKMQKAVPDQVFAWDSLGDLKLWIPRQDYVGETNVEIFYKDATGDPKSQIVSVVFANPYTKTLLIICSVGIVAGLVVLVYALAKQVAHTSALSAKSGGPISILLLDPDTNTYSLSKFQIYAWLITGLMGYVYLTLSKSWVQGVLAFQDVPGGLPGIIGISAVTTVLSQWISATKGTKGAGQIDPAFSDFITTGGVVAADRLQFFVWTVIGCASYLWYTFLSDPLTLVDLPTVPVGFMQLMGLSSVGYLGGKLARKTGPVIRSAMLIPPDGALVPPPPGDTIRAEVSGVASGAQVLIQDYTAKPGEYRFTILDPPGANLEEATRIEITLSGDALSRLTTAFTGVPAKPPLLTIKNPDGQRAESSLTSS